MPSMRYDRVSPSSRLRSKIETSVGLPLHARVGIATRPVVVGDLLGSAAADERRVVGETPNLAARLHSVAAPDMVVVAEGTRRLLGALFELRISTRKTSRGLPRMRAFAAVRVSPWRAGSRRCTLAG